VATKTAPGRARFWRVSVPFTRGTPPWQLRTRLLRRRRRGFSPLHEGDTSVAGSFLLMLPTGWLVSVPFTRGTPPWHAATVKLAIRIDRFSPLHEGDTSVA